MLLKLFGVLFFSLGCWAHEGAPEPYSKEPAPLVASEVPKEIQNVGIKEHLGDQVDLNMTFKDEDGKTVQLTQYIDGSKPVIISPVYYNCPRLCNFHLNGMTEALQKVDWNPGEKYQMIAVSFDAKETPDLALKKKANYMKLYNRPGTEGGWHFLTADQKTIDQLTKELGFEFKWNEESKEWSHASAAIVISPTGKITRYLPGIIFEPKTVKLALTEAGEGKIGSFVDSLVLYCFHYNPHKSEYTLAAFQLMKLGGLLMVIVLAIWLVPVWIRAWKAENPRS
jgi:protein SCO1/2